MKRYGITIALAILVALLCCMTVVSAAMANPDSNPTVEIDIYRNSIETGDMVLIAYANIPYATMPTDPVTSTFLWSLIDTDNVTVLGSTVGYAYNKNGYGYNIYSMYWSAANFTAQGMVWGTSYTLRLAGNPTYFASPPVYNYNINAADYSAQTVKADVQNEIGDRVLALAADLNNKWGLLTVYYLNTENELGTVLSLYGEAFFRGAIYGLQAMAPNIFGVVMRVIDIEDRVWTDNYTEQLVNQYAGTWVETSQEAGKALFGTTYDLLSVMLMLVMALGLVYGNIAITGDSWNGLIDASLVSIIGAKLGLYDFAFLILLAAIAWIYISAKIWYRLFG